LRPRQRRYVPPLEEHFMLSRAIWAVVFVVIVVLTAVVTSYIARLPESNCSTSVISETWSEDRVYKATTQVKDCNAGETQFYSVRVDAHGPQLPHGGWFATYDVKDDERNPGPPDVYWDAPRTLSIDMKTGTLSGSIRQNAGDDLTVIQTYTAKTPNQFPNFW
jgi:hypothetical protein